MTKKTLSQITSDLVWSEQGKHFTVQPILISSPSVAFSLNVCWDIMAFLRLSCLTCAAVIEHQAGQAQSGILGHHAPRPVGTQQLPSEGPCQTYMLFWSETCSFLQESRIPFISWSPAHAFSALELLPQTHLAFLFQLAQHWDFKSSLKINLIPNMIYNIPSNSLPYPRKLHQLLTDVPSEEK